MTRTPLLITLVAAAALAGCNKENHTIVAGPDGDDDNAAANAPVALPPSIASSKSIAARTTSSSTSTGCRTARRAREEDIATRGRRQADHAAAAMSDCKGDAERASPITYNGQSCKA